MYSRSGYMAGAVAEASPDVRALFLRRVYNYLFLTVLVSVAVAAAVFSSRDTVVAVAHLRLPLWIAAFVILMVTGAARHQTMFNTALLFVFAAIMGAAVAPTIYLAELQAHGVALQAGVLTGAVFGGLSLYAWWSKQDFSFLGGFLFMGLIAMILSGVLFMLIGRSMPDQSRQLMYMAYCCGGVLLFSGYVLYDTSRIMLRYPSGAVIPAVIALYLDLLNLFLFILRLLASTQRRD